MLADSCVICYNTNMGETKKRIGLIAFFLVLFSAVLWGQTMPDTAVRQMDAAFAEKSVQKITVLLTTWNGTPWYSRAEDYTLRLARQLVINNELELARDVALAIIDNNLDNKDAVGLYRSVQQAILRRDTEAQKAEELRTVELFRTQSEETQARAQISRDYQAVQSRETGKKIFLDQDFNPHFRTIAWDANIGLASFSAQLISGNLDFHYGLAVHASVFHRGETVLAGVDLDGGVQVLNLMGTPSVSMHGLLVGSFANRNLNQYLVGRIGGGVFGYDMGMEGINEIFFATPVVGLGFRDIPIGGANRLQLSLDYYPGHLYTPDLIVAAGANLHLSFVLAEMQDFNVHFNIGIRDTLLIFSTGLRNDAKLTLYFGVGNKE